jgi:Zn finger protein HypA/HybF involved in hydrogenase expression
MNIDTDFEPTATSSAEIPGVSYRYECLCQVCWHQFQLASKDAPHICPECAGKEEAA